MGSEKIAFAQNLKHFINISGKEQKKICADLGLPESSMSDYVHGKSMPRYKTIERIADYFGVKMSDMIIGNAAENEPAYQRAVSKVWHNHFKDVVWSKEEMQQIIDFADYLLNKRER